jgi:hypothetical protein
MVMIFSSPALISRRAAQIFTGKMARFLAGANKHT